MFTENKSNILESTASKLKRFFYRYFLSAAIKNLRRCCDTTASNGRKGFYRIHPATARKVHDEILLEKLQKLYSTKSEMEQYDESCVKEKKVSLNLDESKELQKTSIDQLILIPFSVMMLLCYSVAFYFAF